MSHELKIASHHASPVLLYSAALASGCLIRTSVTHCTTSTDADASTDTDQNAESSASRSGNGYQ